MIQKLRKLSLKILNDLNKISQKLSTSEDLIVKNLGKKINIPEENLHPFIEQGLNLEEFTPLLRYMHLV